MKKWNVRLYCRFKDDWCEFKEMYEVEAENAWDAFQEASGEFDISVYDKETKQHYADITDAEIHAIDGTESDFFEFNK